jgi:hypothetical protein
VKEKPDENNYAQKKRSSTYAVNLYGRNSLMTNKYTIQVTN